MLSAKTKLAIIFHANSKSSSAFMEKNAFLRILIFAFLILSCNTGNAQVSLDLKSALQYTLENHSTIQKAKIDVQIGKQTLRGAISTGLPQISANATILNNLSLRTSLIPAEFIGGQPGDVAQLQFGTNWNANAGIGLDQMIFNKQWLIALEATKKLEDFYTINLELSKEDVVHQTAKLYYLILLTETEKNILQANLEQIDGLLTVTKKQYENGFAKKIDYDRLRVQKSNLQTQITNIDLLTQQSVRSLKFAMQMPLDTEILLTDTISETPIAEVNPILAVPIYDQRPMIGLMNVQRQLYDLDRRRWKSGYFPTVSLFANYTYEWQADELNKFSEGNRWTDFSQIGLYFNIPIFDGMFKDSKIQTVQLNSLKTNFDIKSTKLAYQLQHQNAVTSLQVNQNNLATVKDTRQVAEEVYRISQKRYKEGLAPITELLSAETSMREAQTNYFSTLAKIKLAEIDLLHANGKLVGLAEE